MKKNINKVLAISIVLILLISATACGKSQTRELKVAFDHVFDAGVYESLDFEAGNSFWAKDYDNWEPAVGCTSVAKTLDDGTTIIGRNMDLTVSEKAAYFFKTNVPGYFQTINLAYTYRDFAPLYQDVLEKGASKEFTDILPFICDDVLNEEGLYIELNMREGENWPDGTPKYSCSGTNPKATTRIYAFEVPTYVGLNCGTIEDALKYIDTIDIYTKNGYWNYCFMLADATGRYGVLEIAQDKIVWNEGQVAHTNFYVSPEFNAINQYKTGVGRYEYALANVGKVKNETDMFNLMNDLCYSTAYDYKNCKFDWRSELVHTYPWYTYDYIMDEANAEEIDMLAQYIFSEYSTLTRDDLIANGDYWESAFTEVVNCNNKTIYIRFFEDNSKIITLSFDKPKGDYIPIDL